MVTTGSLGGEQGAEIGVGVASEMPARRVLPKAAIRAWTSGNW